MRAFIIEKFFEDGIAEGFLFCKICKAKLKSERLSNLKRHIRTMHKVDIEALQNVTLSTALRAENKPKRKKNIKINISFSQLLRSCIGLVTEDNVPLNSLYSGNLRSIIDPICKSINKNTGQMTQLNALTWGRSLQVVANDVRDVIKEELNNKLLSIKVNSSNNCYIIMAQFMEEDMRTVTLGLAKMEKDMKKLSSIIAEVKKTLSKYDISMNRVVSITVGSSNASFENGTDAHLKDIQICQCVGVVANQCAQDVIFNDEIQKNLDICRQIVRLTDATQSLRGAFDLNKLRIPQIDSDSHFQSTYDMVSAIHSARILFKNPKYATGDIDDKAYPIPLTLWDFLECFIDAMGPLYRTLTKYLENDLNYSDFYAQWLKCKLSTECIVKKNASCTNSLKYQIGSAVLDSMQRRNIETDYLYACLVMDPRFHRMLNPVQKAKAVVFLKKLWDKICDLSPEKCMIASSPKTAATADIEDELLDKYLSESIEQKSTVESVNVYLKIDCLQLPFLKSDADVVNFWKDKRVTEPELYQLSKICFAIPSTQVISKSVSLAVDSVVRKNHDCSVDNLENMLLAKLNTLYLDKAIVGCLPMFENLKRNQSYGQSDGLCLLDNASNSWPNFYEQNVDMQDEYNNANSSNNDSCVESHNLLNIMDGLSKGNLSRTKNSSQSIKGPSVKCESDKYDDEESHKSNDSSKSLKNTNTIPVQGSTNDQSGEDQDNRIEKSTRRRQKRSECLCVMCGKKFTTLHSLKTHMLQHSGKRNFKCSKCPKSFVCLSGLSTHEKIHTSHKPYVCEICGRSFRTRFELKLHKRYHAGTKNYQCDYCELRFIANGHKQRHMRIHTGEKPYTCKYCDRAFIQSNDLNKHLKQHLGENIYECRFCDLGFPLLRDLRIHLTTHKDETGTQASILESRKAKDKNLKAV